MKNKVFEINVDFETKSAVDTDLIKIVKGDYNSIEFDLKMDKTDYKRAVLFLVKPSKKNFVVDIANSKAIFTEKNTFDEVGIYYYGIVLYGINSKLTTSTKGKIQVVEGYNEDNENITGDDNYPILDKLIEEVTDLKDKINASLGVMNKTFKEVTYDPSTGVMSFKNLNNEVTNINLPLSLLISSASYDNDNKKIVLTLANNDTIDIPVLDLVSNYYDDKINANKEYIASTSNELYRLKTDVLETGESSGNNIHLEDSALSEAQEISVDGVCEQKTTTGKNLLPKTTKITQTINGITFNINEDGTIVANGTASDKATLYLGNSTTLASGTYTTSSGLNGISGVRFGLEVGNNYLNTNTSRTDTFDSEIMIKNSYYQIDSGIKVNNLILKPMIEQGSEATNYEDYTGCQPSPSPNFPRKIKTLTGDIKLTSCGENIFNYRNISNLSSSINIDENDYIYTLNPTADTRSWKYNNSDYFLTLPTGTFYIKLFAKKATQNKNAGFNLFDSDNLVIVNALSGELGNNEIVKKFTLTQPKKLGLMLKLYDGKYRISITKKDTSWNPYIFSEMTATIPSNEFVGKINDTYKDTLNVVYKNGGHYHLILNKMVGKIVLDGTENWSYDSNNKYFRANTYAFERIPLSLSPENKAMYSQISNSFIINNNWSGTNSFRDNLNVQGEFYPVQNAGYKLAFRNLNFDNVDDFKSYLSSKNIIVVYPLETTYEVDLGIVDTLLTFDEITNIFTNSDLYPVINVKYYRNFIKTIQNLQVNNDTLKNELSNIESRLAALESANTSVVDNNPSDTEESEVTE